MWGVFFFIYAGSIELVALGVLLLALEFVFSLGLSWPGRRVYV